MEPTLRTKFACHGTAAGVMFVTFDRSYDIRWLRDDPCRLFTRVCGVPPRPWVTMP